MIIEQYTDTAGKVRIQWQSAQTGNIYVYKFDAEPDEARLIELSDASDAAAALALIEPLGVDFSESEAAINAFIDKVFEMPTMTLTNYNSYLNTLFWTDEAAIRNFVSVASQRLEARGDIELSMPTEGTVVREVRDYILSKTTEQLARLIFNR